MSQVKIVRALPIDIPVILAFINELAAYEKLADQVTASEAILHENIFVKRAAEVIFAEDADGTKLGFAIFYQNFSTFIGKPGIYLEDLFVKPEARGRGIGKMLLAYLAKLTNDLGFARLDWAVLDWNEPALKFYNSIGAKPLEDWTTYRLQGEALLNMGRGYPRN